MDCGLSNIVNGVAGRDLMDKFRMLRGLVGVGKIKQAEKIISFFALLASE